MIPVRSTVLIVLLIALAACAAAPRVTDGTPTTPSDPVPTSGPAPTWATTEPAVTSAPATTKPSSTSSTSASTTTPSTTSPPATTPSATTPPATAPLTAPPAPTNPATTVPRPATTVPAALPVGRSDGTLVTPDGRTRTYHLYVPRGLDPAGAPLLVALHGGTGSGGQFETTTGFDALADRHRFVVVYPDGVGTGTAEDTLRTWNAGICCGPAVRKGVDDVGFVRRLIDTLSAKATIDPRRVFAAGHSNGAFMAYRLACELSDRIVAVGLQAGGLGVPRCTPSRPVSLLHIHGTADTNVPIAGGTGSGISGVTFPPLDQSLGIVTAAMGCNSMTGPTVSGRVTTTQWTRGGGAVAVERRLVDGEPHRWIRVADFDSSTAIVDFLLAHPRA